MDAPDADPPGAARAHLLGTPPRTPMPDWLIDPATVGFWAFWLLIGVELVLGLVWAVAAIVMFLITAVTGDLRR